MLSDGNQIDVNSLERFLTLIKTPDYLYSAIIHFKVNKKFNGTGGDYPK